MKIFARSLGLKNIFKLAILGFRYNKMSYNYTSKDQDKNKFPSQEKKETIYTTEKGKSSESSGFSQQQSQSQSYDFSRAEFKEESVKSIERLIVIDHNLVRAIYDKFMGATSKDEMDRWRNEFVYELARHSIAEEVILYPVLREKFPDGEQIFKTSINEHHEIKKHLYDAQNVSVDSVEFRQKVKETMDLLIKHMMKEEKDILPQFVKLIPEEERISLGKSFDRRKMIVPTKAHTMVPEDPPTLNSILGLLTSPIDRFRDLFSAFPEKQNIDQLKKEAEKAKPQSFNKDKETFKNQN